MVAIAIMLLYLDMFLLVMKSTSYALVTAGSIVTI